MVRFWWEKVTNYLIYYKDKFIIKIDDEIKCLILKLKYWNVYYIFILGFMNF